MTSTSPSPLVLGAMMFGITIDEPTSFALLDRFVERGGEWIDTADCYAFWASESGFGGDSERLLGRWLAARPGMRERVKIATKIGAEPRVAGGFPAARKGLAPAAVHEAFDGSLERLGVDSVDLLWLHMEDRSTPIEQTTEALAEITGSGRAARIGASNHPAWRVERSRARSRELGATPIDAFQLNRTYLRPEPGTELTDHRFGIMEDEQVDYAQQNGIDLWAYTPLLSGAYDNPAKEIPAAYRHPRSERQLAELTAVAGELGLARGQVVLAWLWGSTPAVHPILGGSKPEQLEAAMDAMEVELPAELRARLDAAAGPFRSGPVETPVAAG